MDFEKKKQTKQEMGWRRVGNATKVLGTEPGCGWACGKCFSALWFLVDGKLASQLYLTL